MRASDLFNGLNLTTFAHCVYAGQGEDFGGLFMAPSPERWSLVKTGTAQCALSHLGDKCGVRSQSLDDYDARASSATSTHAP